MTVSADFSATPDRQHGAEIQRLCDAMEAADQAGRYPRLTVERPWSVHNPVLEGEFASPEAIRWYLARELSRLAASGARISVGPGREALDLRDPGLAPAVDESRWDLPAADLRSADEPLLGTTDAEPTQAPSPVNVTPDHQDNI